MPTPVNRTARLRITAISLLLLLVTLAVYWPVSHHEFVSYDDVDFVTQNPHVQAGLTAEGFKWAWHSQVARNWHPVTMLSHMLDCQLFKLDAGKHHLVSLCLHAANALLLFLLLNTMTGAPYRSALASALFAWHPLHVESVAWIAERKDVLSAFFFMLTLLAYVRYVRSARLPPLPLPRNRNPSPTPHPRSAQPAQTGVLLPPSGSAPPDSGSPLHAGLFYVLSLLLFALGLMSKPMLVTLPFVLLLLDYWPLGRFSFPIPRPNARARQPNRTPAGAPSAPRAMRLLWPLLAEKIPFFALSAACSFVTWSVQSQGGAVWGQLALPARLGNAVVSYILYLGKMVWSMRLAAFYPFGNPWPGLAVVAALLLLLLITILALRNRSRRPWLLTGWFWYLGTLVPVIGVVQVGMQAMADRYTYLPLIGIFLCVVWGGTELLTAGRIPRPLAATAAIATLLGCLVVTHIQLGYWKNSETLYRRMLAVTKDNFTAQYDLGDVCYLKGNLDEAGEHYAEAVRLSPEWPNAQNNLGDVLMRQKHYEEAARHFSEAVRLKPVFLHHLNLANALASAGRPSEAVPHFQEALRLNPASAEAHRYYALVLGMLKRIDEAAEHYQAALKLKPDLENAEFELGNLLANNSRVEQALPHYRAAIRLNPNAPEPYNGLGFCLSLQGKWDEAAESFSHALRLKPSFWLARKNLGLVCVSQQKYAEAIPHLLQALDLKPGDALVHARLARCFAQTGKRAEAEAHFQQALQLDPANAEAQEGLHALRAGK